MGSGDSALGKVWRFLPRYFYAVACSLYLFSLGAFKNRILIYRICEYFGWAAPTWDNRPPQLLPEVPAQDVVSGDTAIKVFEARTSGNTSLLETNILSKLVRQSAPQQVFEIGTFDGRTTLHFAANSDERARIFTLDLPRGQSAATKFDVCDNEKRYIEIPDTGRRFKGTAYEGKVTQLLGDSASFDFSPYFGQMDFVFVDGSHAYDYVLNDSQAAIRLVKDDGIVVWHDYGEWDGVTKALNELRAQDARFRHLKHIEGTTLALLRRTDR